MNSACRYSICLKMRSKGLGTDSHTDSRARVDRFRSARARSHTKRAYPLASNFKISYLCNQGLHSLRKLRAINKDGRMDEKHGLPRPAAAPRAYSFSSRTPRRAPTVASILIISLILLWCFQPALVPRFHRMAASHLPLLGEGGDAKQQHRSGLADNATLVPLEAHIMSKCPDAMDCLQQLILPVMERVAPLVDFKLSFIGECVPHDLLKRIMH